MLEDIIKEYDELWNGAASSFYEQFPTSDDFDSALLEEIYYDVDEELTMDMSDDEILEEFWSPEIEAYIVRYSCGLKIDKDISVNDWCEFYNKLIDAEW
jgi:hypothetical protein